PPPTPRTSASKFAIWEVTPETYRAEASKGQEAPGDVPARRLLPFATPVGSSTTALAPARDHGARRTRREKDEGRGLGRRRRARIRSRTWIEHRARIGSRRIVDRSGTRIGSRRVIDWSRARSGSRASVDRRRT